VIELDEDRSPIWSLEASPDGRALAAIGYDKAWVWDADSGQAVRLKTDQLRSVAWRPDGRQLVGAVMDAETIQVFDRDGTVLHTIPGDDGYEARAVDINGEGVVAVAEKPIGRADLARHRVTLRDAATGELIRVLPAEGLAGPLAFDPSGQRLALAFIDGHVEVRDLVTDARTILAGHVGEVFDVTWADDGARVATSGPDGTVRVWDAATGVPIVVLRGHGSGVVQVRFSPDGSSLASSGRDDVRIWALDIDDLVAVARRNVTRQLSRQECLEYLHLDACPVITE
jgi:dipeptidyl aminopeptidase/acylaminoacyl peptidase